MENFAKPVAIFWLGLGGLACGLHSAAAHAETVNVETKGNLVPTQDLGCLALEATPASMSPPDLAMSVIACLQTDRPKEASELYLLMLARGRFDTLRVADKTAHQGIGVLKMQLGEVLEPAQADALKRGLQGIAADMDSADYAALCQRIAALGTPTHDPAYMIQHGMQAVMGGTDAPLVAGFAADQAWQEVMQGYLKCKL